MKTLALLLCLTGLAAATRTGRIAVYGYPETENAKYFPFPYYRNTPTRYAPLRLADITHRPITLLLRDSVNPEKLLTHHLKGGLSSLDATWKNHFHPINEKVAVLAYPWELLNNKPSVKLSDFARATMKDAEEPYLMIQGRSDFGDIRTENLKELGELEVLEDAVRVAREQYSPSLFPISYYNPYLHSDVPYRSSVYDYYRYRYPFYQGLYQYDDYYSQHVPFRSPYYNSLLNPYRGLYYYPQSAPSVYPYHYPHYYRNHQFDDAGYEDDYLRYDIYSHPAVKPVAIVPGDEYAMYYPSSYPILGGVVPAPPPPTTQPVSPIAPIAPISPIGPLGKVPVHQDEEN